VRDFDSQNKPGVRIGQIALALRDSKRHASGGHVDQLLKITRLAKQPIHRPYDDPADLSLLDAMEHRLLPRAADAALPRGQAVVHMNLALRQATAHATARQWVTMFIK
jgi:hypothetical protein